MSARAYIEPGKIPPAVKELLETLRRGGFAAYPVGGAVRDLLLGKQPHDWDVTTAARPEQAEALLSGCRVIETGVRHGTITVLARETPVELTTFRGEGSYTDGRHPDAVTFGVGLEEDLSRRDFTIGAMAWNAETGEVIDPFGGQADLENRLIRAVGEPDRRFAEDGLRILRGLRFAAVLGFEIEPGTADALRRNAPRLKNLSPERDEGRVGKAAVRSGPPPRCCGSMLMSLGWCCRSCCRWWALCRITPTTGKMFGSTP